MAWRRILATGFFVLILIQVLSSSAAGGSCSGMSQTLGDGCTISNDCSTVTCKMDFVNEPITFTLKVNKCDKPVTVTASMDVPDLFVTWSHTYTSDEIIEVPGFAASVKGFLSAGVYVQVELKDNGDRLHLKVKLLAGGKLFLKSVYPVKETVIKGDLPISTIFCATSKQWYDSDDVKAAMYAGAGLLVIIGCCCCCCCCCGYCCGSRSRNRRVVVVAPAARPTAAMTVNSNITVPIQAQVNVAT